MMIVFLSEAAMFLIGFATIVKAASAGRSGSAPHLDYGMLANFGLVLLALLSFGEYRRSRVYACILALSTAAMAALGLYHGTWAQSSLLAAWSIVAYRQGRPLDRAHLVAAAAAPVDPKWHPESRFGELLHGCRYAPDDLSRN